MTVLPQPHLMRHTLKGTERKGNVTLNIPLELYFIPYTLKEVKEVVVKRKRKETENIALCEVKLNVKGESRRSTRLLV